MTDLVEVLARAMAEATDIYVTQAETCAAVALTALEAAGYRVVPVEPTAEMRAAWDEKCPGDLGLDEALSVILAAAPKTEA